MVSSLQNRNDQNGHVLNETGMENDNSATSEYKPVSGVKDYHFIFTQSGLNLRFYHRKKERRETQRHSHCLFYHMCLILIA